MHKILLLYSSTDGHTIKITEYIQQYLLNKSLDVTVKDLTLIAAEELETFDILIIGAAIRYGKHKPEVYQFIEQNRPALEQKRTGFFSVCLVARKPNKNTPDTNPYYKKFLQRSRWSPQIQAVFAGKVIYPAYSWFDRSMIRFIMWMTKGPTAVDTVIEFTDWDRVTSFAEEIARMNSKTP